MGNKSLKFPNSSIKWNFSYDQREKPTFPPESVKKICFPLKSFVDQEIRCLDFVSCVRGICVNYLSDLRGFNFFNSKLPVLLSIIKYLQLDLNYSYLSNLSSIFTYFKTGFYLRDVQKSKTCACIYNLICFPVEIKHKLDCC